MHYLTQDFEIMMTPKHVIEQMNKDDALEEIKIKVWGKKPKDKKEEMPSKIYTQKFDLESSVKDFKSIILNFTGNKPYVLRFNIDNDCKIS